MDNKKTAKGNFTLERNSNIELLRIVLIFMVILLHFNNESMGGAFVISKVLPKTNFALHFFESLSICAVNCFMIISGYFLLGNKKIKFSKIASIMLTVIFYGCIDYFLCVVLREEIFSVRNLIRSMLPINYFANFYCICYLFSPFVSKLYAEMDGKTSAIYTGCLILIFVAIPTVLDLGADITGHSFDSLSPVTITGDSAGYSVVQFFVDLCLGMYLRKTSFHLDTKILIPAYIFVSLTMTILVGKLHSLYSYCSVFTVLNAVFLFCIFSNMKVENSVVNFISTSVFAVYCIHISRFANLLWTKYLIRCEYFCGSVWQNLLWSCVCVLAMYLFSLLISIIMRLIFQKIKDSLCSFFPEVIPMYSNKEG